MDKDKQLYELMNKDNERLYKAFKKQTRLFFTWIGISISMPFLVHFSLGGIWTWIVAILSVFVAAMLTRIYYVVKKYEKLKNS